MPSLDFPIPQSKLFHDFIIYFIILLLICTNSKMTGNTLRCKNSLLKTFTQKFSRLKNMTQVMSIYVYGHQTHLSRMTSVVDSDISIYLTTILNMPKENCVAIVLLNY